MKFQPGHTVGIDLGTSYSSIATLDTAGQPVVIENSLGRPITPSIVLLEGGGNVLVGPNAQKVADAPSASVVIGIKREMGNSAFFITHEGRKLTPELLSSMILTKLKQDAEKTLGPIGNAVITVPYYFNDPKRQATRHAGRIAGLNVIDIINEPTAATLAYAWQRNELGNPELLRKQKTVLVYDLGGGTFDVTVVRYSATEFHVLATDGDTMLGGLDWTARIADFAAAKFEAAHGLDPRTDPHTKQLLMLEAEAAKRDLSLRTQTTINFEFRGRTIAVEFDRPKFESITADLLQRTQDTTEFVLDQAKLKISDVDEVLLVGGSTSMPMVPEMLNTTLKRVPSRELNPHVAVAQGAAIHAAILEAKHTDGHGNVGQAAVRRLRSITTHDVNSHSLGVEIQDRKDPNVKLNHIMIPRNSRLPAKCMQRFVTTTGKPSSIHLKLLQGETADVTGCEYIGDFRLTELPQNLPAGSPVELVYAITAEGIIQVKAKELTGLNKAEVAIDWSHGLDEKQIDGMAQIARKYQVT